MKDIHTLLLAGEGAIISTESASLVAKVFVVFLCRALLLCVRSLIQEESDVDDDEFVGGVLLGDKVFPTCLGSIVAIYKENQ